ncbi:MAG TPA: transglutaminase domain-containing protein [Isosphaeraceae bacterium]|nr:transglutaminase domain-containing protein [Isosphaeraceae bacterium]
MSFQALYRVSFYVMLTLATLVLSIDASTDSKIAMLYPPAVAVACAIAFLTVDRNPRLGLSRTMGYALWGILTGLVYLEWSVTGHLLLALAHWLVYHQLIEIFMVKTVENDWLLFGLGLMQVLVGTVISQSDVVGASLFAWAVSALWVLGLFYLHREALRTPEPKAKTAAAAGLNAGPYPGLIELSFVLSSLRVALITLALGGVIFLSMPRTKGSGQSIRGGALPKHLTGFGEEVQLGQLGEILENDSVVMTVELFDGNNDRIKLGTDPLWRGVSMGVYEQGRWQRVRARPKGLSSEPRRHIAAQDTILQRIKLEATDTSILFALRPVLDAEAQEDRMPPELSIVDGSLQRSDSRSGTYDYRVWSDKYPDHVQPNEQFPDFVRQQDLVQVPEDVRVRLRAIAEPIVQGIPTTDRARRARALEIYLRDSGKFGYTLRMDVTDPTIDPVLDFLINRKQGHCAYFASALTLLLRSIDIPARMINGFKGGDWNDLSGLLTVREKHAHSWVEALVDEQIAAQEGRRSPVWLTLDPTPALARDETVEKVGGVPPRFRVFSDFIRYVWVFYIAGYDEDRQRRLIYEPIMNLVSMARRGFRAIGLGIASVLGRVFHFPSVGSFFSTRGFLATFFTLVLIVLVFRVFSRVVRWLMRWLRGAGNDVSSLSVGVAVYRRLTQLLAEVGLERPPPETPREFARRAGGFLNGLGSEPLAELPGEVVEAYYSIRFGDHELPVEILERLEQRLDNLEATLRPAN